MCTECKFARAGNDLKASKVVGRSVRNHAKPLPAGAKAHDDPGLRQRKLQKTCERLSRTAPALFLERHFETTIIEDARRSESWSGEGAREKPEAFV